jgi:hypothetical protein
MSYDGEKFTWEFRVDHFTKWGPDEESDDEDAPMDEPEERKEIIQPKADIIETKVLSQIDNIEMDASLRPNFENSLPMRSDALNDTQSEKRMLLDSESESQARESFMSRKQQRAEHSIEISKMMIRNDQDSQRQAAEKIRARIQ